MGRRFRSHRGPRRRVEASQTVEVRAKMRALEWLAKEFPEEYEDLRRGGVVQPKNELARRHWGRFLELWRDEIRWVLKDDELTGTPSYRDRSKGSPGT